MFRQVIAHRWAPAATDDDRRRFREAAQALCAVPEVSALRCGDDAAHFEGNHDFVAVLDFPDFAAARRYVETDPHRRFVDDHARRVMDSRIVVQHDWAVGVPCGVHHLKLPVSDVSRSRDWYRDAFGFECAHEFHEDGALCGVAMHQPEAEVRLALRRDPVRARALAGFDTVCLAVGTRADLDILLIRLDDARIAHAEPVVGLGGWAADVADPDGHVVRVHTLI